MSKRATARGQDIDAYLRAGACYWNKTGVPKGIARAEQLATALDKGDMSLAELHQAWCAQHEDLLTYSGASIHSDEKREMIRRLLDEREDVMTELFARLDKLEMRKLEARRCPS